MLQFKFEKIGAKLTFTKEDSNVAVYDLSDGSTYINGRKNKDLKRFFAGSELLDIIAIIKEQNVHYGKLLSQVYQLHNRCSNLGTLLKHYKDKYMRFEQWYAVGVYVNLNQGAYYAEDTFKLTPKNILPLLRDVVNIYGELYIFNLQNLFNDKDKIADKAKILLHLHENINLFSSDAIRQLMCTEDGMYFGCLINIINDFNLDYKKAIEYLAYLITYESPEKLFKNWRDYLRMQGQIFMRTNHNYSKYPKYLLSNHDITVHIYNTLKYANVSLPFDENLEFYDDTTFAIICPKESKELVDEGINLRHCVKSYIDRVLEKKTNVVFLRDKKNLHQSYITIEVQNNQIIQAQGACRRALTLNEKNFITKYAREKKLLLKGKL